MGVNLIFATFSKPGMVVGNNLLIRKMQSYFNKDVFRGPDRHIKKYWEVNMARTSPLNLRDV